MREGIADIIHILLAILLPPTGVFLKFGCHEEFWTCLLLTILGYLPGILYAIAIFAISHRRYPSYPCLPSHSAPMKNIFHAMGPQSVPCRVSSKKACYDVFINHCGKDVKHKLASTIYNTFDLIGVPAFLDQDELELGDSFPQAIEEAMLGASVHVAIFSPSYAESRWCLDELSLMLQINATIIPVFYGVNPSDLRYAAKGTYADAFRRHLRKRRYTPEQIESWKEALRRVSDLSGCILNADKCDEGKLLRDIVETALHKMKKVPLQVATFPVGLDEAIQDFESKVGSSREGENVHIVGIVGMGGSGKTTLAKELYNRKLSSMRCSFLSNVRDAASTSTLHNLQKQLLQNLRIQHPQFHSKEEGMGILAKYLRSMTVLIILDDVGDVDQMLALLPPMHHLGRGSFIIVTTRMKDILTSWGISSIYHIKLLDRFNAKHLFCIHAFLRPYSELGIEHLAENIDNFQDLIVKFVEACKGLPLSLKVLGAMVNGKSKEYWESQLLEISRILPDKVADSLKLSYEALNREVQQMFLDVACFFLGKEKSLVVAIWDGSGWSGVLGLETLVDKCLVGVDEHGFIDMHDHLRDLGREIARDVAPSRIWKEEQISNQGGTTQIRGIVVGLSRQQFRVMHYPPPLEHCLEEIIKRPSSPSLQLLAVRGNDFRKECAALSRDLVWLSLCDFNGTNLPSWLSLPNLRVLELHNAKILEELWQDNMQLPLQLTQLIIDLSGRTCFQGFPNSIGHLRHLRKIVLNGSGMRRLPQEFRHLGSLEILQLSHSPQLEELPDLTTLVSLRQLYLRNTGLRRLPDSICQLTKLETLVIGSVNLTSLPESVGELSRLTSLEIDNCKMLESLPQTFEFLYDLRSLKIIGTPIQELGFAESPREFKSLQCLALVWTRVCEITIYHACCPRLEKLWLSCNIYLKAINCLPKSVREIIVEGCEKLEQMEGIRDLLSLENLVVTDCRKLRLLPNPSYMFSVGCKVAISGCPKTDYNNYFRDGVEL